MAIQQYRFILLGMIIEAVAEKPYGEFVTERMFMPLGMNDTTYYEPPANSTNRAVGYEWQEDAYHASPYFPGGFAAGGLVSTVARWLSGISPLIHISFSREKA